MNDWMGLLRVVSQRWRRVVQRRVKDSEGNGGPFLRQRDTPSFWVFLRKSCWAHKSRFKHFFFFYKIGSPVFMLMFRSCNFNHLQPETLDSTEEMCWTDKAQGRPRFGAMWTALRLALSSKEQAMFHALLWLIRIPTAQSPKEHVAKNKKRILAVATWMFANAIAAFPFPHLECEGEKNPVSRPDSGRLVCPGSVLSSADISS